MTDSNLGHLSEIGGANGAALDSLGTVLGAAADISGAIGLVTFVVGALSTDGSSPIESLAEQLLASFQQLGALLAAEDIQTRNTNLGNSLAPAGAVLQGLHADLSANLTKGEVDARINTCSTTLNSLSDLLDDEAFLGVWFMPYENQVYWQDYPTIGIIEGYGSSDPRQPPPRGAYRYSYDAQVPGQDPTAPQGTVYSYILAMPAFLEAVTIWLTVARALAPTTFADDYGESIIVPVAEFLKAQHDKIVDEGLVMLSPIQHQPEPLGGDMPSAGPIGIIPGGVLDDEPDPSPYYGGPVGTAQPIWVESNATIDPPTPVAWTGSTLYNWWPGFPDNYSGPATLDGVGPYYCSSVGDAFENTDLTWQGHATAVVYGTVEVFAGFSKLGLYSFQAGGAPDSVFDEIGSVLDQRSSDLAPYNKFRLRLLQTQKDVYTAVGMASVWRTVNVLRGIADLGPLPGPKPSDWSLRTVSDIVGVTTVRAMIEFIRATPPDDVPNEVPVGSLRGVLEGFTFVSLAPL